ncbi:MAG: hypothetical protein U5K75_11005 [Ahrensia sp.]|nr:hypothetical protein [Ahrensia sp.]
MDMINLTDRRDATQATVDKWLNQPFSWGAADCAKMTLDHLRNMGHRPKIAKAGAWKTAASASAAVRRMGCGDLVDVIDKMGHVRINGAQAIAGDIAAIEATHSMGCLCVCIGPNQWLSLHQEADGFTVIAIDQFLAAWRIEWHEQ